MREIEELLAATGERLAAVVAWMPFGIPVGALGCAIIAALVVGKAFATLAARVSRSR